MLKPKESRSAKRKKEKAYSTQLLLENLQKSKQCAVSYSKKGDWIRTRSKYGLVQEGEECKIVVAVETYGELCFRVSRLLDPWGAAYFEGIDNAGFHLYPLHDLRETFFEEVNPDEHSGQT